MTLKKTLVLGIILLGLILLIFYKEIPDELKESEAKKIFAGLNQKSIKSISVKGEKGDFTLVNTEYLDQSSKSEEEKKEKTEEINLKWELQNPKGAETNSLLVKSLVQAIKDLTFENPIPKTEEEKDLSVYGLNPPSLEVKLSRKDEESGIKLGKFNDFTSKRYAQSTKTEGIYFITDTLFHAANKPKDDFRERTPIKFVDDSVTKIVLKGDKKAYTFSIDGNKVWKITEPVATLAAPSAISELTRTLRNLRVEKFFDFEDGNLKLADFGLEQPSVVAEIFFKDSVDAPLTIKVGKVSKKDAPSSKEEKDNKVEGSTDEKQEVFFNIEGTNSVYSVLSDPTPIILKEIDLYREKNQFTFAIDALKKVEFAYGDGRILIIEKTSLDGKETFKVNGKEGDEVFIRELLNNLTGLTAESFIYETKDLGFNKPKLKVTVTLDEEGKELQKVLIIGGEDRVSKESIRGYYAGVGDLSEPFLISQQSLDRISGREETLTVGAKAE